MDIIYYNNLSVIFSMYIDCSKLKEVSEVTTIPERSSHTIENIIRKYPSQMDRIQTEIDSTQ